MKRKLFTGICILALAVLCTMASVLVSGVSLMEGFCGGSSNRVERGFPLPIITTWPSVSLCEPAESFSVLITGNVSHEEHPGNFVLNLAFWSGFLFCAAAAVRFVRRTTKLK